jgi:DNA repair exonuclease SbcCD nuclease subunit
MTTPENDNINDLTNIIKPEILCETKYIIETIIHIADIHIGNERNDEYIQVFTNLCKMLETKNKKKTIIVVCGDIIDDKNKARENTLIILHDFFNKLNSLNIPCIIIPGNHDVDTKNTTSYGLLSTLIKIMSSYKNIKYLTESGLYIYNNIMFTVSSVFNNNYIINRNQIPKNDKILVYLYHGTVGSPKLYNDTILNNKTISLKDFEGYDYVLLGDIHKHQFLNDEKTIAYSGSLIQQNHGESLLGHGFIEYNLKNKTAQHFNVDNEYGFVTVNVENNIAENIFIPKKCRIKYRVNMQNTDKSKLQHIMEEHMKKYNVIKQSIENTNEIKNCVVNYDIPLDNLVETYGDKHKFVEISLKSIENNTIYTPQSQYVKQFLEDVENIPHTMRNIVEWNILYMRYSNMLVYGENNFIDFTLMKNNVVNIYGENASGKSTIFDVLTWCIFGVCSKVQNKFKETIINNLDIDTNKKKEYNCEVAISIGNILYIITREGKLSGASSTDHRKKMEETLKFISYTTDMDNIDAEKIYFKDKCYTKLLDYTTTKTTQSTIISIFGTYKEFISTTLMTQSQEQNFGSMTPCKRREFIEELYGLNKYNLLSEISKERQKELKNTKLEKKSQINDIILEDYEKLLSLQKNITTKLEKYEQKMDDTYKKIEKLTCGEDLMNYTIDDLRQNITNTNNKINCIKECIVVMENERQKLYKRMTIDNMLSAYQLLLNNKIDKKTLKIIDENVDKLNKERECIIMDSNLNYYETITQIKNKENELVLLVEKEKKYIEIINYIEKTKESLDINTLFDIIAYYKTEFNKLNKQNGVIEEQLNNYNINKEKNIKLQCEIDILDNQIECETVYYKMVSIYMPSLVLHSILSQLQYITNEIIKQLSSFTVEFVVSDTSEIDIITNRYGKKTLIASECGSDIFTVNLCMRVALSLYSHIPHTNCILFDEGFASYDKNKILLTNNLLKYLKTKFNYIIVISHLEQIQGFSSMTCEIKRKGLLSNIILQDETQSYPTNIGVIQKKDLKDYENNINDTNIVLIDQDSIKIAKETPIQKPVKKILVKKVKQQQLKKIVIYSNE